MRIADDPDSWIKPEDLKPACPYCLHPLGQPHDPKCDRPQLEVTVVPTCELCGVVWMYHDNAKCIGEKVEP